MINLPSLQISRFRCGSKTEIIEKEDQSLFRAVLWCFQAVWEPLIDFLSHPRPRPDFQSDSQCIHKHEVTLEGWLRSLALWTSSFVSLTSAVSTRMDWWRCGWLWSGFIDPTVSRLIFLIFLTILSFLWWTNTRSM